MSTNRIFPARAHDFREAFLLWLDAYGWSYPDPADLRDEQRRAAFAQLWNCADQMPADCCRQLKLPVGSTFASAVRGLFAAADVAPEFDADWLAEAA